LLKKSCFSQLPQGRLGFEFEGPDPDNDPTVFAEKAVLKSVSLDVSLDFLHPECPVGFGDIGSGGMPVPEFAIHKDSDLEFSEYEIRAYGNVSILIFDFENSVSAPLPDSVDLEQSNQGHFCTFISFPPDPGHHFGTFGFGENVGH